jgi:hypothetical protein
MAKKASDKKKIPVKNASGRGTHSSRRSIARLAIGRIARVRKCHLTVRTSELHASGCKSRYVQTLHTENLKLEENLKKKYFP